MPLLRPAGLARKLVELFFRGKDGKRLDDAPEIAGVPRRPGALPDRAGGRDVQRRAKNRHVVQTAKQFKPRQHF